MAAAAMAALRVGAAMEAVMELVTVAATELVVATVVASRAVVVMEAAMVVASRAVVVMEAAMAEAMAVDKLAAMAPVTVAAMVAAMDITRGHVLLQPKLEMPMRVL